MTTNTNPATQESRGLNRHLKTLLLFVLAILLFWWFGRGLNWAEVRNSLSHADLKYLAVAILTVSLTYLLRAYRWQALLKPLTSASLRDLFIANVVGFSAFFLVGRAGEVVRPALLPMRDRNIRPAASFATILVERICDFAAVVLLFAVNLAWFRAPAGQEADFSYVREIGLILLGGTLAGLTILFFFARKSDQLIRLLDRSVSNWRAPLQRPGRILISMLDQLGKALQVLAYPREFVVVSLWTALLWFIIVLSNILIIRAFGVEFGFRETIFMLGFALVGSLIPTPGGSAGAFHAAAAAGLIFLGVKRELAAAISILVHLVDFGPALAFALYYLIRGDVTLSRLRTFRPTETSTIANQVYS